ncbi:hypothetical protein J8J27_31770, partial [Mycobacterium tuberculosis]|nr:hypothetical protein [Mycobacterium tuberculosis]
NPPLCCSQFGIPLRDPWASPANRRTTRATRLMRPCGAVAAAALGRPKVDGARDCVADQPNGLHSE